MNPSQTKTLLSNISIPPCGCGSESFIRKNMDNGLQLISIHCENCGRETMPYFLPEIAVKYWDIIKDIPYRKRLLWYNFWGNCMDPIFDSITERINRGFINISLFNDNGMFFYGYTIRISKIIKSHTASILDKTYDRALDAKRAARNELRTICGTDQKAKKAFSDFTIISYSQLEFFE